VQRAVFLDRDNTLIANDGDLGDPAAVRLLDGVAPGLLSLREAGYRLIVVTNQGGVARGAFGEADVDAVHQRIAALVDETTPSGEVIDRFYYCPYHPQAALKDYRRDHPWRKPHPGMLLQAARDLDLDLRQCWMVGDQERDITAGRSAGCRTILLASQERHMSGTAPTLAVTSFPQAVGAILRSNGAPTEAMGAAAPTPPVPSTPPPPARSSGPPTTAPTNKPAEGLHRAVTELTEEIRVSRMRGGEFTAMRLAAALCQLLAMLMAFMGLLHLSSFEDFMRWMIGAMLAQLFTIADLLADSRR
jgi:D-glycero-D-manno-heptose 1,7-bisphosphate phosphatase